VNENLQTCYSAVMRPNSEMRMLLLTLLLSLRAMASDPLDDWTWRNPLPTGIPMYSVTYGGGKFIAVGYAGTAVVSDDGTNWFARQTSVIGEEYLFSVTYGNGQYVAVGPRSIVTSSDATNWSWIAPPTAALLSTVAFGGGLFVAAGDGGTILTSSNGTNWAKRYEQAGLFGAGLAYGNGRFLAAFASSGALLTSTDGLSWVQSTNIGFGFRGVAFGNGVFVALNVSSTSLGAPLGVLVSTNGLAWEIATTAQQLFEPVGGGVIYDQTRFIATSYPNLVHTSLDGRNWSVVQMQNGPGFLAGAMTFGEGQYAMLTGSVPGLSTIEGKIHLSSDLIHWTTNESRILPLAVTRVFLQGSNRVVVAGEGPIMVATNGGGFMTNATSGSFSAGAYSGNGFVLLAGGGNIVRSADATTWTPRSTGGSALQGIAFGGGTFIAVGNSGDIRTSPDGTAWSGRFSGVSADLYGVAHGNSVFVAVGVGGVIISSPDAIGWTMRDSATTNNLRCVAFGNGYFFVGGDAGTIRISPDGTNWTAVNAHTAASFGFAASNRGNLILANRNEYNLGLTYGFTEIFTSTDAISWRQRRAPFDGGLTGIGVTDKTFVLLGQRSAIAESGELSPIALIRPRRTVSGFHLLATGDPGPARLQRSSDLLTWSDVLTFTNAGNSTPVTDPGGTNAHYFYRVVVP
jgi:hypothetical protein